LVILLNNMKKNWRNITVIIILGIFTLVVISVFNAVAASNTVPVTHADKDSFGLGVTEVTPPQCAGMGLTNIVDVGAGQSGTAANDLILGTAGDDLLIEGGAGNDCILGGGGNDRRRIFFFFWIWGLDGGEGNDVIIGGPGTDVCRGGGGADTFYGCETTY
jgi:Ca2+-binding RTX toxin-like protein